jgi:CDP-glycerol glycerophosphotransferase
MQKISKLLRYIVYILFLPIWYLERLIPRNKKIWIFGAWFGKKYSDNSRALYEYMLREHPEYTIVWITKNKQIYDKLILEKKPVAMANSIEGIKVCSLAYTAIINNGPADFNQYFLNGIKKIWLWHGMPLKKIGFDQDSKQNRSIIQKRLSQILNPYHNNSPNITITSSRFFIALLQSAFHLTEEKILKTGLPRCDVFFSNKTEKLIDEIRNQFVGCKVIFYMPTFRTSLQNGITFDPFADFGFEETVFFNILREKNLIFLYKPHFADESSNKYLNNTRFFYIDDNSFDNLYALLKDIDLLVTDYSSVYFDFITMGKPVILAPFDYDFYLKNARSHYFNYFENMEGIKAYSWNELYKILENETYYRISNGTIDKYCKYNDGNACEKCFIEIMRVLF